MTKVLKLLAFIFEQPSYKKPKRPFDASLQLNTYISFSENICCAYTFYSLMLLFNGYVGFALREEK